MPDQGPVPIERRPLAELAHDVRQYAIFTMDLSGAILSWNEGVQALLGYHEDEFVGMACERLFTDADRDADVPSHELRRAIDEGEAQDDRWHVAKDGEHRWVNGLVTPIRDERGQPVGFVKIMRDQTAFRRAHDALAETEERFSKAFWSSPTPVAILRLPEGEVTDANEALMRTFGREGDDPRGRTLGHLLAYGDEAAESILRELGRGRAVVRREAAFVRDDQDRGRGSFAFEPVEIGGETHAVMLMHDVTDRLAARDESERQKALVEGILASLPGIFYMVDPDSDGALIRWNDDLERITGYDGAELDAMRVVDLVLEEDLDLAATDIAAGLPERRVTVEARLRRKDGTVVPYLFTLHRALLPEGRYVVGVGLSIEKQKRAQHALVRRARQQEAIADLAERLLEATEMHDTLETTIEVVAAVLRASAVHVLRLDDSGELAVASATDAQVAQRRAETLSARETGVLSDDGPHRRELPAGEAHDALRAVVRTAEGPYGLIEALAAQPYGSDGEEGRFLDTIASLIGTAAERHRLHRSLVHQAEHDPLTGLPNRIPIEIHLDNAIERAERARGQVAVVLLDLDRFKHVNDSLGHHAGDELLAHVADRLRESVRGMDTVARLGGDEFVIVVPDIFDETEAAHVAERVLASFEQPFVVGDRELSVRTTLGIALFPGDGRKADTLLRAADRAMYQGKASGRGTYRFARAERGTEVGKRLELENALREALTFGQLELAYQPRVDLATDRVVAVEALIRWRHPVHGILLPGTFLPLAEEIGLAAEIDEWVLREACAKLPAFDQAGRSPLRIAVNVAPRHLLQPSFPERMGLLAREAGVAPARIEIEIDESALLDDPEVVTRHLRGLVALGFTLTLDDFGTGHAALAPLRDVPFSRIKIDESHVHALTRPRHASAPFAETLISMADDLAGEVVAEGVETAEQRGAVGRHGCGYAQGRLFADALEGDELEAYLRSTA